MTKADITRLRNLTDKSRAESLNNSETSHFKRLTLQKKNEARPETASVLRQPKR